MMYRKTKEEENGERSTGREKERNHFIQSPVSLSGLFLAFVQPFSDFLCLWRFKVSTSCQEGNVLVQTCRRNPPLIGQRGQDWQDPEANKSAPSPQFTPPSSVISS